MKTLLLLRHAKASRDDFIQRDVDRPLTPKGITRSSIVTDHLKKHHAQVDCIVSSHAVRALQTAQIIAHALDYPAEGIIIEPVIYHGNANQIEAFIFGMPDEIQNLMIVGHNPSVTHLANFFLSAPIDWLPTSGLISLTFITEQWNQLSGSKSRTNFVIYPAMELK